MFQNAMLPAGFRQRDQTKKSPTGPFDRSALLDHLEKQALEHQDREDLVPFTGEKKGSLATPSVKREGYFMESFFQTKYQSLSREEICSQTRSRKDPRRRADHSGARVGRSSKKCHGCWDVWHCRWVEWHTPQQFSAKATLLCWQIDQSCPYI